MYLEVPYGCGFRVCRRFSFTRIMEQERDRLDRFQR
jgi:hypothetical protein